MDGGSDSGLFAPAAGSIGITSLGSEKLRVHSTGLTIFGNTINNGYSQFNDVAAPVNALDGQGLLYKKTGNDGLFWLPDSGGAEIDLTVVGGVSDHGTLSGLLDDDHTQYTLLLGRSGGQTLIGGTAASDDLTLTSTSDATKGSIIISDPLTTKNYVQFTDVSAPVNPLDGEGRLYKKTSDDGLFWLPDSGGAEIDLTVRSAVTSSVVSASTLTQTNSATFIPIGGMTIAPADGDYLVTFSGTGYLDAKNQQAQFSIFVGSTEQTSSTRTVGVDMNAGISTMRCIYHTQVIVSITGNTITAQFKSNGVNPISMENRNLTILRLNALPNYNTTATSVTQTNSSTFVPIPSTTISPNAGTYLATFSATGYLDVKDQTGAISIFNNGVESTTSTLTVGVDMNNGAATMRHSYTTQSLVSVAGGTSIDVRFKSDGINPITVENRSLVLIQVN